VHSNNFRHNTFWTSLKMFWVFFCCLSNNIRFTSDESGRVIIYLFFTKLFFNIMKFDHCKCCDVLFHETWKKEMQWFFFVICTASVWMWINNDREEIIPSVVLDFIKRSGYAKDENSKIIFNIDLKYSVMLIETRGALWILTTSPWRLAVF
jgi:hypothetical protein